VTVWNSAI